LADSVFSEVGFRYEILITPSALRLSFDSGTPTF
jgi:hypothetical protein